MSCFVSGENYCETKVSCFVISLSGHFFRSQPKTHSALRDVADPRVRTLPTVTCGDDGRRVEGEVNCADVEDILESVEALAACIAPPNALSVANGPSMPCVLRSLGLAYPGQTRHANLKGEKKCGERQLMGWTIIQGELFCALGPAAIPAASL